MNARILFSTCVFLSVAAAQAVTIDFELGGPSFFGSANPLREEYAGLGAHFSGPGPLDGGAVLNAVGGSWGAPAVSGSDILGFNSTAVMANGGSPVGPERVDFDFGLSAVSVWYSGSSTNASIGELRAFDANDVEIGFHSVVVDGGQWALLDLSGIGEIAWISINTQNEATWMLDDMNFTPVPEPATFIAIGIGLAGLALARRKR